MGAGSIFGGAGNLFGDFMSHNPYNASKGYLDQYEHQLPGYYNDYIHRGGRAGSDLEGRYGSLLNDPGGLQNKIGQGYHQSPGFKFALQQALGAGNNAAAAGGMSGTPQHQQRNMKTATGLADQDYNHWLSNSLGLYNQGLTGEQGMYGTGFNASNALAQGMGSAFGAQAQNAAQQAQWGNRNRQRTIGDSLGFLGF